ncbi:MAG: O-antigen ligase family protein [Streptosporangiaceae bacterium]
MLALYGRLVGLLLAGYMLFDKAFAYIHLPGTPLYVGEMVLVVGALGCLAATGYLRVVVRDDPMLALLAAFFLWGFVRFLPGLRLYGIYAARDFAIVYYCMFAFFIAAALERSPEILERLIIQLNRFVPWLLLWLPFGVILDRSVSPTGLAAGPESGPFVPFTAISIVSHKTDDAAIAAIVALGSLWLFPAGRSARSRGLWSILGLIDVMVAGAQSRGGLLSALLGIMVGLAFFRDRMRLVVRAVACIALAAAIGVLFSLQVSGTASSQQRAFSVSQLFANVESLGGAHEAGDLNNTVQSRLSLWSEVLDKQVSDDRLVYGYGFGTNLAYLAGGVTASGNLNSDPLRDPHNSDLDVLARLGVIGVSLWVALWVGWFYRLVCGCRRLAQRGLYVRRRVAVLCLMVVSAILLSSFFDPQLEGAQVAALLWIAFGIGLAVTSFRAWFGDRDLNLYIVAR